MCCQVLRIIRAWSAYTRFLVFSSEQGGSRARDGGAISGALEPQNTSGLMEQQLNIAGVAVPELWVKRYYVPYGGTQRRVRLCIHIDSGLAGIEEPPKGPVPEGDGLSTDDPPPPFPGLSDSDDSEVVENSVSKNAGDMHICETPSSSLSSSPSLSSRSARALSSLFAGRFNGLLR